MGLVGDREVGSVSRWVRVVSCNEVRFSMS